MGAAPHPLPYAAHAKETNVGDLVPPSASLTEHSQGPGAHRLSVFAILPREGRMTTMSMALSTASSSFLANAAAPRACMRPSRSVVRCGLSSPTTRTTTWLPAGRAAAASRRLSTTSSTRHVAARGLGSESTAMNDELYVVRLSELDGSMSAVGRAHCDPDAPVARRLPPRTN